METELTRFFSLKPIAQIKVSLDKNSYNFY